jgi:hypothetical protein
VGVLALIVVSIYTYQAYRLMKPEYLAVVAVIIPSVGTFVLFLWEKSPIWVRRTAAVATLFSTILSGFAALWISNESTALITGGDSFCFVVNMGSNPPFPAVLVKNGDYPLYDVVMRVTNLTEPFRPMQGVVPKLFGISLFVGDLPVGGYASEIPFSLPPKDDRASFNIFFSARNGSWSEELRLRLVNGNWKKAFRVFRLLPGRRNETQLVKEVDKGFPTEGGTVKW